jgi:hypothetical protein
MSSSTTHIWRRIGYATSFLVVAGVAAYVSYGHIAEVAALGHQPPLLAKLMPLSVDGLMLIATLAMAEDKAANRQPRGWARFSFWFGAAISTAANIAATAVHYGDPLSIVVAAFAPIALLLAIEIVARPGKPKEEAAAPVVVEQTVKMEQAPDTMAELESPTLEEAPVSPAPASFSERHERRLRRGK